MIESFVTILLAVLVSELGGPNQLLAAALAMRFRASPGLWIGLTLAAGFSAMLSAAVGAGVHYMIAGPALLLFHSLSFLFAGASMLFWRQRVDTLGDWKRSALFTGFVGLAALQVGDSSQFLIGATSARYGMPLVSALAGWLGVMLALVPALLLRDKMAQFLPLTGLRRAGGLVLLLIGLAMAGTALSAR